MKGSLLVPCLLVVISVSGLADSAFGQSSPATADRTIVRLHGDLYRAQEGTQHTVFLVTPDGILLADPLNIDFALWLKDELEGRFPQRPVRHVVYSTVDVDRIEGAGAFRPLAATIAHSTFNERLHIERQRIPRKYVPFDLNASGTLEREELESLTLPPSIAQRDRNSDGHLTADELWSRAPFSERTYGNREVLTLGDVRVELVYAGPATGAGDTLIFFPSERTVFAARHPALAAPFQDPSVRVSDLVKWADTIAHLDFDTFVTAQGEEIPRSQFASFAEYIDTLVKRVTVAQQHGQSLQQILRGSDTPTFSGTPFAGTRDSDLASLYRRVQPMLVEVHGAALINHVSLNHTGCDEGYYTCAFSSPSGAAASAGVSFLWRHLHTSGEVSALNQINGNTTSIPPSYAPLSPRSRSSFATRDTYVTLLAGVRTAPANRVSIDVLGGPTFVRTKSAIVQSGSPFSSPTPILVNTRSLALTLGADVRAAIAKRVVVIVPVRLTTSGDEQLPAYGATVRAGVGLSLTLFRWASPSGN